MPSLDSSALQHALSQLPYWTLNAARPALERTFLFADFAQAFAFMTEMAFFSEKQDHHPEWTNVYHRVNVILITHDVGGVSQRDIMWAQAADAAFARYESVAPSSGAR